jgi:hypothetical protein
MHSPQDRIVKKMIDNIVERNRPEFERPVVSEAPQQAVQQGTAPALATEDYNLITRKLEYGFSSLRQENADLRKMVEDLKGTLNIIRNDMDNLRASLRNRPAPAEEQHKEAPVNVPPTGMGAPQYRKTAADEEFERKSGATEEEEKPQQARGFAKKEADVGIDIGKVFYYGKK